MRRAQFRKCPGCRLPVVQVLEGDVHPDAPYMFRIPGRVELDGSTVTELLHQATLGVLNPHVCFRQQMRGLV